MSNLPEAYTAAKENGAFAGDKNFCAPLAISIVAEISPLEAQVACILQGRKKGKGTVFHTQTKPALEELGFDVERIYIKAKTVKTIEKELAAKKDGGKYLIRVKRHILAFSEGKVQDWSKGSLKRVYKVYKVTKKD